VSVAPCPVARGENATTYLIDMLTIGPAVRRRKTLTHTWATCSSAARYIHVANTGRCTHQGWAEVATWE
jgi:hypothetical protein